MLSTVLIVGRDSTLLDTRALILGRDGFRVLIARDHAQADQLMARQPVDLLILCHTLSEHERQSILAVAHASHPALRALALVANAASYPAEGQEAIVSTLDGPPTLLAAVHELTEVPPLAPHA